MKNLTLKNIASACGGIFRGGEDSFDLEITAITTDSRKITPGCLFAAIKGERADGHDFIAAALKDGAACVLCERLPSGFSGNAIVTDSTLSALGKIARLYRVGFDIPFIGITGSVGKTTTKEMTAGVLSQKYNVHKTAGNFNNELGVPLTLFELSDVHTAAVIEMGISGFGEMRRLTNMVLPSYAIITNIGNAHLEGLGDKKGVLLAKAEILEGLDTNGTVFVNGDDELFRSLKTAHKKVTFGLSEYCDITARDITITAEGGTSCVIARGDRAIPIDIPAYGDHMVYAALAACSVGIELGLSDDEIKKGAASYVPVSGRARVIKNGELTIIDDCYNANPTSVACALSSLSRLPGRHVCVLGDMLELGEKTKELHYETGKAVRDSGVPLLLTCGPFSASTAEGAGDIAKHFESKEGLIDGLVDIILPGDTVLVKASRGSAFEDIVSALEKLEK